MITRVTADGFNIGEELLKYTNDKLERFERLVPRAERTTASIEAIFTLKGSSKTCELVLKFRRQEMTARESTQHFYASLDIAVVAIEAELKRFRKSTGSGLRKYLRP